jgi:mRNA interferase MazF
MPLKFPPFPGTILRCDFHTFKEPEMTKNRPVIVLSPKIKDITHTTLLVAPLSTTEPKPVHKHHLLLTLPGTTLPQGLSRECWLKGDMIYALSLKRFDFYHFERDKISGKRSYYMDRFMGKELFAIRKAVMHAIGLH